MKTNGSASRRRSSMPATRRHVRWLERHLRQQASVLMKKQWTLQRLSERIAGAR